MIPRSLHRLFAQLGGLYWIPCPLCGEFFGEHEKDGGTLWVSPNRGERVCRDCADDARRLSQGVFVPLGIVLRPGETFTASIPLSELLSDH